MWAFSLIPDAIMHWIINILIIAGVLGAIAGFFLKFIPFVTKYRLATQIVSILLLVLGVWLKGGESERLVWQKRVADLEEKVKIAEKKADDASKKIQIRVVEKVKIIRENAGQLASEAGAAITPEMNAQCVIPKESANKFNQAAKGAAK